ncbi:hypothetical protein P4O66_002784 [Electrophorus voltai]|uniref:Astrotactin 2 n=1 Tax=Electrophorus voltai TaxID=2609070 RepID=A0AAD8YVJ1_9TELE|nr:hypothetical protein P4O66_002784 [Electrophorus voltai]
MAAASLAVTSGAISRLETLDTDLPKPMAPESHIATSASTNQRWRNRRGRQRKRLRMAWDLFRLHICCRGVTSYLWHEVLIDAPTPDHTAHFPREVLSLVDDLFSGLGSSCVVPGRRTGDHPHTVIYSLILRCLEPDSLYKFTLYAVDSRGSRSESSYVTVRTSCPMVDDSRAEELADKVYNLYNGYTSGKEQQTAYNTLMEVSPPVLYRVQHHYNSHYEKFGDFVWRSEDELGPSALCRSLLRSGYIQSRTETVPYAMCRSEDARAPGSAWHRSLHETRLVCVEKLLSVQRNVYGKSKLRTHAWLRNASRAGTWAPLPPSCQLKDNVTAVNPLSVLLPSVAHGEGVGHAPSAQRVHMLPFAVLRGAGIPARALTPYIARRREQDHLQEGEIHNSSVNKNTDWLGGCQGTGIRA